MPHQPTCACTLVSNRVEGHRVPPRRQRLMGNMGIEGVSRRRHRQLEAPPTSSTTTSSPDQPSRVAVNVDALSAVPKLLMSTATFTFQVMASGSDVSRSCAV